MALVETGVLQVLKNDETGELFWRTYDEGSKGSFDFDDNHPLTMLPVAFGEGTVLKVLQPETQPNKSLKVDLRQN